MRIIVLDTNIYGWYLAYTLKGSRQLQAIDAFILISKLIEDRIKGKHQITILATDRIIKEITAAKNPNLETIVYSLISGVIKSKKEIDTLTYDYLLKARKLKLRVDKEDCEIIAAATISRTRWFVTENRLTINNPRFKMVIEEANNKKKLPIPKILNSKEANDELLV